MNQSKNRLRYVAMINRAIDFIEANLDEELSLDQVARFSRFSEFHFHRIFSSIVGETFGKFVQRIRIERSAMMLLNSDSAITEVAYNCGFSSSASFSRLFKEYFSCTPSQWREDPLKNSKIRIVQSSNHHIHSSSGKDIRVSSSYNRDTHGFEWTVFLREKEFSRVRIEHLPRREIAYVRHIGEYMGDEELFRSLYEKIFRWGGARKLLNEETRSYSFYHDDPSITEGSRLRVSVGIDIPPSTEVSGDICRMIIPEGEYAIARYELDVCEIGLAWKVLFSDWFPESGYMCGEGLPYETPLCDPRDHPEGKHLFEICTPVLPL